MGNPNVRGSAHAVRPSTGERQPDRDDGSFRPSLTIADLEAADHRHELPERENLTVTLAEYRIPPGETAFEVRLRPFTEDGRSPNGLL